MLKFRTQKVCWLALAMVLMLIISGCSAKNTSTSNSGSNAPAKLKVALLLPGPISDNGWNATAYQGLKDAETQYGVEGAYVENVAQSNQASQFRTFAQQGYNVIIGHGYEFEDAAKTVAKEFPNVKFIVTSSSTTQAPNVGSVNIVSQQAGFLGGVAAAMLSKTGKVADVGGMDIPPIQTFITGFKQGVKYGNQLTGKNVQAMSAVTGTFDDVAKNKETARAFINRGCDVILGDADQSQVGIIQAATEAKVMAIGVGGDCSSLAPDTVVTNTLRSNTMAIAYVIKSIQDGTWQPKYYPVGINEGACGLVLNDKQKSKFSDKDLQLLDQVVADFKADKIDLNTLPQ